MQNVPARCARAGLRAQSDAISPRENRWKISLLWELRVSYVGLQSLEHARLFNVLESRVDILNRGSAASEGHSRGRWGRLGREP